MTDIQNSVCFWLLLIGILAFLAVLPTLIAIARGTEDLGFILMANVICCITVFGWPIALIAALKWPRRYPRLPRTPCQRPPAPPLSYCRSSITGTKALVPEAPPLTELSCPGRRTARHVRRGGTMRF